MTASAPGRPGIEPRWTSSAKEAIGSARSVASPLWFTLSHGILNEVYYPRIDQACLRDAEFLVTTPDGRFFEEKRQGFHETRALQEGVPAYVVETRDPEGAFLLRKRFITDPERPVLLVDVEFAPDDGWTDYTLVFLAAPHLGNRGKGNVAWVSDYKGVPMLYATRSQVTMAVATSAPLTARSVGFVGFSDAWQDLRQHHTLSSRWERAEDGNIAMAFQPDLAACGGRFTVAMSFGGSAAEAGLRAVASLEEGFVGRFALYAGEWEAWNEGVHVPGGPDQVGRASALVLATHQARSVPGGSIASLSIPWGFAKGDEDLGGYHLVWPRDHVEAAGALFAIGANDDGLRALGYLRATQEADGHWPQNMWLDGTPFWAGIQMDETALPVLLTDLAVRAGAVKMESVVSDYWPMVRRAAGYIVGHGPATAQDRWEEDGGYSPFTLATEIVALLTAAEVAEAAGEAGIAEYLRSTADCWDGQIEDWCYTSSTDLARAVGVDGYYVRIGAPDTGEACSPLDGWVPIKNRPPGEDGLPVRSVVSPDALALVRFGLRRPDDPRIENTVRVIDATLRRDFDYGSGWYRYSDDGYGEHDDGRPFDGTGRGRVWPLLTGERAHYELAAGRLGDARSLAATMRAMAGDQGLLPEQIWDGPDLADRGLFSGRPAGSAMPLVWAHAEYLKLLRSIDDGEVFDLPGSVRRHVPDPVAGRRRLWRTNHRIRSIPVGSTLRVELLAPAVVHWSMDGWITTVDSPTHDTGIGMHIVDLDTSGLPPGDELSFTLRWADRWEGHDYAVVVR